MNFKDYYFCLTDLTYLFVSKYKFDLQKGGPQTVRLGS